MRRLDRLTAEDARILRLESGSIRGHTCKVVIAAGEPAVSELRSQIESRLDRFPRLRRRLAPTPLGIADPVWVEDPDFDIARHVVEARQDRPVDRGRLREIVAGLMTRRLERDRPLWRIDVVAPLEDGGTALVTRLHHCLADGMTAIRILSEVVLDPESPGEETRGPRPAREPLDAPGWAALLALGARDRALGAAAGAGRGALAIGSPSAWRRAAVTAWRLPGAVRRDLLPSGERSPLDATAGSERVVAFVSRPLEELRRIAKVFATGVKINDVVLAATAGGLRHWLEREGRPVAELRAKVPVSLHQPGEATAAAANRDSFMVVGLGLEQRDPVERLLAISAATRDRKRHHDAQEIDALFHDLGRLSHSLERLAQRWAVGSRVFAVNVSNVPGPARSLSLLGGPVRELYSVAEIANRHALRVSAISAGGRLAFGLCADPVAVHDIDAVASGLGRELDDLLART